MPQLAFITGATSGSALPAPSRFAVAGWSLVLCGRRQDRLDALHAELAGIPVYAFPARRARRRGRQGRHC